MIRNVRNVVLFALAAGSLAFLLFSPPSSSVGNVPAAQSGHGHGAGEGHGDEGVEMNDAKVAAANIELVKAGPGVLRNTLTLNGIIQPNQEAVVQATPRFPGIVREIGKRIGDKVAKDDLLAKIESNQSLTVYEMRAPIAGTVIDRQISLGEYASEQKPSFIIADLSTVWIDLLVYRRDLSRVRKGDQVLVDPEDGNAPIDARISYISPVGSSDTQSALARAVVGNAEGRLRPGLFVTGRLVLAAKEVPLTVKTSALQTVENRTVVFVRNGDAFEPRDVELGDRSPEEAEVVFGLLEGDVYAARNSFLIKAELAKGSATHEH